MKQFLSHILLIFFTLHPHLVFSNDKLPDPVRFKLFNKRDGLPSNTINDIYQDKSGFIWLATENGLCRYDGHEFKVFRNIKGDSASIISNSIRSISQDLNGNIWVTTNEGHVCKLDPVTKKFSNFYFQKENKTNFPGGRAERIWFDNDSCIWVGYFKGGFAFYDKSSNKMRKFNLTHIHKGYSLAEQQIYNTVYSFYDDLQGTIWIASHNGLYKFDKENKKLIYVRKENHTPGVIRGDLFLKILGSKNDQLWLASYAGGIVKYDIEKNTFTNFYFSKNKEISATSNLCENIVWKSASEIWIASLDMGFGFFNIKDTTFRFFDERSGRDFEEKASIPTLPTNEVFEDKSGNIWIAHKNGLSNFNKYDKFFPLNEIKVENSTNNQFYYFSDFLIDTITGKLYIASKFADGLKINNIKTGSVKTLPFHRMVNEEAHYIINDLMKDSHGNIWVVTRDKIYQIEKNSDLLIPGLDPPLDSTFYFSPRFKKIEEDQSGNLWIATTKHGVFKYNTKTKIYTSYNQTTGKTGGLKSSNVSDIVCDKNGKIWLINDFTNLYYYENSSNSFIDVSYNESDSSTVPAERIYRFTTDLYGEVWMATSSGAINISYDETSKHKFEKSQNITQEIFDLAITDDQSMVFTTRSGIGVHLAKINKLKYFDSNHGFNEDFPGFSLVNLNHNRVWVGTYSGYYEINTTDLLTIEPFIPNLAITSFKIMGYEYLLKNKTDSIYIVNLDHNHNFISFDFADLSFRNTNQVKFEYYLEGLESSWIEAGQRRFAGYDNLKPGKYKFRIRAMGDNNEWAKGPVVEVNIKPAFYTTWWFYLLSSALFTSLIFTGYKYRINMVRREESIKSEYQQRLSEMEMSALRAQMNPHFIFNCLNSINRYIVKSDQDTASLYLTKFSKLIRLILDNSKSKYVTLDKELHALRLYIEMESLRFDHKFKYRIETDQNLNLSSIEIPPMLLQPYIENAIWHGLLHKEGEGNIDIRIKQDNDFLICEIEDDGIGRAKSIDYKSKSATKEKSHGMKITSDRLAILNSENFENSSVTIHDLIDADGNAAGTKVVLLVKIHENHNF